MKDKLKAETKVCDSGLKRDLDRIKEIQERLKDKKPIFPEKDKKDITRSVVESLSSETSEEFGFSLDQVTEEVRRGNFSHVNGGLETAGGMLQVLLNEILRLQKENGHLREELSDSNYWIKKQRDEISQRAKDPMRAALSKAVKNLGLRRKPRLSPRDAQSLIEEIEKITKNSQKDKS